MRDVRRNVQHAVTAFCIVAGAFAVFISQNQPKHVIFLLQRSSVKIKSIFHEMIHD
jgi:hypothetical protein